MTIEKRRLGRTDLEVTTLGLGGATLGGSMELVTDDDAKAIFATAYDAGIRYFDTAPFYGFGASEHRVGDALRARADWVLSTKVGRRLAPRPEPHDPKGQWKSPFPFDAVFDYSYDGVMRSYEDSLQRLGLNRIDILFVHDPDVYVAKVGGDASTLAKAIEGAYKALDELRRTGAVKALGLGVNEVAPIVEAMKHGRWDCFLLAGRYTLLEQAPLHTLFPALKAHGATIIVGGPFNSGILVGREIWNYARAPQAVIDRARRLAAVCEAHNVPLPAAALGFVLANPIVSSVIPGPAKAAELKQIVAWWNQAIPAALWSDLKSEKLIDPEAPVPA